LCRYCGCCFDDYYDDDCAAAAAADDDYDDTDHVVNPIIEFRFCC
jgi:hypothetical protein